MIDRFLMQYEYHGLAITLAALLLIFITLRLRKRLTSVSTIGWGRICAGFSWFMLSGILIFIQSVPQFMKLFVPIVGVWIDLISKSALILGMIWIVWGIANLVSGIRRFEELRSDDEDWQKFYLQLLDLAGQPFSFIEILNVTVKQLARQSQADGAAVLLYKENSDELILAAFSELPPEIARRFERLKIGGDIFGRVQKLGRVQFIDNILDSDKLTEELFKDSGYLSTAVFPLRSGDKILGCTALFAVHPFHFPQRQVAAVTIAVNYLAMILDSVRNDKELKKLKNTLAPSLEAKRITEELFFRRGLEGNLQLREALEFERVRKFFNADCIKLTSGNGGENFRVLASSGGAEQGLMLEKRKIPGITRAVKERKLLLLTSPKAIPAGGGYDSVPRQSLFIPIPYPDRDDLVLLLESDSAIFQFSKEKLSAVKVASVYLADLHFLFQEKMRGEAYRNSFAQLKEILKSLIDANHVNEIFATLSTSAAMLLPNNLAKVILAMENEEWKLVNSSGLDMSGMENSNVKILTEGLAELYKQLGDGEIITNKTELADFLPLQAKPIFRKTFVRLPERLRKFTIPLNVEENFYGLISLYYSQNSRPSKESFELFKQLVSFAGYRIESLLQKENNSNSQAIAENPDDDTNDEIQDSTNSSSTIANIEVEGQEIVEHKNDLLDSPTDGEILNGPRKLHILGIDDQEVIRELLNNIIKGMGHKIKTVSSSNEGLEIFKREKIDLVILEAAMADMDSREIASIIKENSPQTPIIVLSGWELENESDTNMKQYADFILTKPFKMEQLGKIITDAETMLSR